MAGINAALGAEAEDRLCVLLITDDPQLAELYELKLSLDGYDLWKISRNTDWHTSAPQPDLIFLDVEGGTLATLADWARLRSRSQLRQTPAVLLSTERANVLCERGFCPGLLDNVLRVADVDSLRLLPSWERQPELERTPVRRRVSRR
jgi:DNA-binding response OmpR family regulator